MIRSPRGFVLLEALIALLLVGMASLAGAVAVTQATGGARVARDTVAALSIARSRLALAIGQPLQPTYSETVEEDRFVVKMTVSPVPLQPAPEGVSQAASAALYDLTASVRWRSAGQQRVVVLSTRRLAGASIPDVPTSAQTDR